MTSPEMRATVAAAEAAAVALLTAATAPGDLAARQATAVADEPFTHRVLVAFLVVERGLLLGAGPSLVAVPDRVRRPFTLLAAGDADGLRNLLRHELLGREPEAAAGWLRDLARAAVRDMAASDADQLQAWGLAVAADPDGRADRETGARD